MAQSSTTQLNNELFTNKFKLVFREVQSVEILCTEAQLPALDTSPVDVPNQLSQIYVQGNKMRYTPLTLSFKVDENLETYKEVFNWMTAIHKPQSYDQFNEFQKSAFHVKMNNKYKIGFDASLITLKNSDNVNFEAVFTHLFPVNLSSLNFTMNSETVMFATATFQFDYFYFR